MTDESTHHPATDRTAAAPRRRSLLSDERRARLPTPVARLLDRLTRATLGKRGFAAADIIARWPEIVGADLARFACPLQVKFPRGRNAGATLLLRVSSSAAGTMLTHKSPQIIARVNRFFGYEAVTKIEVNHGPLPKPPPPLPGPVEPVECPADVVAQTAGIASPGLREALRKLGARLQHRRSASVVTPGEHT
jgi:hypothetical protein